MSQPSANWEQLFSTLFKASVEKYNRGHVKASGLVEADGHAFLQSIGHTDQEFFDFVEDFARGGEPTLETALQIATVRRDYFLQEQKGKSSSHVIAMDKLPPKDAELEGIGWLPRIIPKAEAKLRGEMPTELMYGCGGDRKFFKTNQIDPAEFLRKVWSTQAEPKVIAAWIKSIGK